MKSFQVRNLIINFLLFLRLKQGSDFWRRRPWQGSLLSVPSVIWKTHLATWNKRKCSLSKYSLQGLLPASSFLLRNLIIIKSPFEKHKQRPGSWPCTAQEHSTKRGWVPSPTGNSLAFVVWLSFVLLNHSPTIPYQKVALDPLLQCCLNICWARLEKQKEVGRTFALQTASFPQTHTMSSSYEHMKSYPVNGNDCCPQVLSRISACI